MHTGKHSSFGAVITNSKIQLIPNSKLAFGNYKIGLYQSLFIFFRMQCYVFTGIVCFNGFGIM